MNANEIICDTIGAWGAWQKRTVFLIYLCKITACWCMAVILFTAPHPKQVPMKCINQTEREWSDNSEVLVNGVLMEYDVLHPEQVDPNDKQFEIDFCDTNSDYSSHTNVAWDRKRLFEKKTDESNATVVECSSLTHKPSYFDKETGFDFICSRNFVAAFTQVFHLAGVLVGGLIGMALMTKYVFNDRKFELIVLVFFYNYIIKIDTS